MTSRTFCIFDISVRKAVRMAALATSATLFAVGQAASAQSAQPPQGAESILQIIMNADAVVKAVMLLLVAASILSWALWFIKRKELRSAKIALKDDIRILIGAPRLAIAKVSYPATAQMIEIAANELERSGDRPTHRTLEGVEDRVGAQLPIVEARAIHQIQWGGNILASIGSISPFVGLAGTVWGIVHSFLGIAQSQSTSLAVVAPGIAEALIATAMGLAAAIPAVLIYNALTRSVAGYRRLLSEVAVLTACILSREIERKDNPKEERRPGIAQRGEPVIALVQNAEAER